MAMRYSMLFDVTTTVKNGQVSHSHSGGWSESFWAGNTSPPFSFLFQDAMDARAALLPQQCSLIGYRIETFTISGNKLLPGGAQSGRVNKPGLQGDDLNVAGDSLMCAGQGRGVPNTNRFALRGMPDSQMSGGEFAPTGPYLSALQNYFGKLVGRFGFIGRVKSNTIVRVNGISGGVVRLSQNIGGTPEESYLRLNRVTDDNGNAVGGTYLITGITGALYTVSGLAGVTLTTPSGTARIDTLDLYTYDSINVGRSVSRKIGRPLDQYRGRASRRR